MKRIRLPSKFHFGVDIPSSEDGLRRVLPFRRSWIAIVVVAVFDAVFIVPAITSFQEAIEGWQSFDSLFDLTTTIFMSAWVLGWSIAPIIMTLAIVLLLTGREVLKARPGVVEVGIGIPGLLLSVNYDANKIRNLRLAHPEKNSGKSWRGTHITFDYGSTTGEFGSALDEGDLIVLTSKIQSATGLSIRRGEASPEELEEEADLDRKKNKPALPISDQQVSMSSELVTGISLFSFSTLILIIANLVPIFGAIFLGWNLADVMVLYWAESAVIGFYNILKMAVISKWLVLLTGPFFISHFGAFMAIHFLFLYGLFVEGPFATTDGDLKEVAQMFYEMWPALAVLFMSHGLSFVTNFIGRKEYKNSSTEKQMKDPYSRIVFMHLVLIIGGGITLVLGSPTPVLLLVIVLKIIFDIRAHLKGHAGNEV